MRRFLGFLAALAAASALLAVRSGPALANHVQCGDIITQGTTLDADLTCPSGQYDYTGNYCKGGIALYVRGPATLDLGGHTLTAGPPIDPYCGTEGIQSLAVGGTVQNGTLQGFDLGVQAEIGTKQLRRLTIVGSDEGIYGSAADISGNTFHANRSAMNVFTGNTSGHLTVARNVVTDTTGDGITVSGSGDLLLDRNVITNSGQHGVHIYSNIVGVPGVPQNGNFIVSRNRTDHNAADGIFSNVPSTTFFKNEASFNGNLGIEAVPGVSGSHNSAQNNGNPAQCAPAYLCRSPRGPKR